MIDPWRTEVEEICNKLIDDMGDVNMIDAAVQYTQHIPVLVVAQMVGLPLADADRFRGWVDMVLGGIGAERTEERMAQFMAMDEYLTKHIEDHIENPRDDLTTYLLNSEIFGEKLSPRHVFGTILLLIIAGIDTTWSGIGSSLWHLATHKEDRERLVREPELIPSAVEEFLRAYSPVTMARIVAEDTEVNGCPMHEGDRILMAFPAANRDPKQFDRPDEVIIDREHNRHVAFGAGIHRCAGSNLARMEMRVAIEEFLARVPDFELRDDAEVTWAGGQVRGPRTIPVRFNKTIGH
jgi:cytochrome P450